ncbi:MAG: response regulator [Myxococcaceae bacterium]
MSESGPLFGDLLVRLGLVTQGQVQEALALQQLSGERVGEALISLGYVRREQLQTALSEALGLVRRDLDRPLLGEVLVGLKYVTPEQLDEALKRQKTDGRRIGEILVELRLCTHRQVYEALGLQQRMAMKGPPAADARGARPAEQSVKVMVIDDSPLACGVVKEGLSRHGYEVVCYQDPFEALEQVQNDKPAIILTDLDMPGIDGAEVCRRLKDGPTRSVPVIILTAFDEDAQKVSGLRAGADDYVNKSASMNELSARIEGILRRAGETEHMRSLFARYTSEAVVDEILKSGEVVLTGEKREVTALFADLRNFTGLSETLPPEQVVGILNQVLGQLSDAVLTCGGTLDKFLGDGLMAVFGAPVGHDDDALRAVQSAQMMMTAMRAINDEGRARFDAGLIAVAPPVLELGIGINSGPAVVGNVGGAIRTEYTCIGDSVNVASRLCSQAGPGEILVGERTGELAGAGVRLEALPAVRLKGKRRTVEVFRAVWNTDND